jgi:hypothetical protein
MDFDGHTSQRLPETSGVVEETADSVRTSMIDCALEEQEQYRKNLMVVGRMSSLDSIACSRFVDATAADLVS